MDYKYTVIDLRAMKMLSIGTKEYVMADFISHHCSNTKSGWMDENTVWDYKILGCDDSDDMYKVLQSLIDKKIVEVKDSTVRIKNKWLKAHTKTYISE